MTLSVATVLIVDDHPPTLQEWEGILASDTLKILTSHTGQRAFEIACESQPDLIVSDLDMPDVDGFQLLTLLKKTNATRDIPVIICSGTVDMTSKYLALTLGAIAYLEKPLSLDAFLNAVEQRCGGMPSPSHIL